MKNERIEKIAYRMIHYKYEKGGLISLNYVGKVSRLLKIPFNILLQEIIIQDYKLNNEPY